MPDEAPAIARARGFLQHHARKLEWALFRHHVEGTSPEGALDHPDSPLAPRFNEPLRQYLHWLRLRQLPRAPGP